MMPPFLESGLLVAMAMVVVAVRLGFIRLLRGPTLADRVLASDMMAAALIAFCALFAIYAAETVYLDIAVTLALVSLLPQVAFARLAERLVRKGDSDG